MRFSESRLISVQRVRCHIIQTKTSVKIEQALHKYLIVLLFGGVSVCPFVFLSLSLFLCLPLSFFSSSLSLVLSSDE